MRMGTQEGFFLKTILMVIGGALFFAESSSAEDHYSKTDSDSMYAEDSAFDIESPITIADPVGDACDLPEPENTTTERTSRDDSSIHPKLSITTTTTTVLVEGREKLETELIVRSITETEEDFVEKPTTHKKSFRQETTTNYIYPS